MRAGLAEQALQFQTTTILAAVLNSEIKLSARCSPALCMGITDVNTGISSILSMDLKVYLGIAQLDSGWLEFVAKGAEEPYGEQVAVGSLPAHADGSSRVYSNPAPAVSHPWKTHPSTSNS